MISLTLPTVNSLQMPLPGATGPGAWPTTLCPLPVVIKAAADAGWESVGIETFSVDAFLASGGTVRDVRAVLDDNGLTCSDVGILRIGEPRETMAAAVRLADLAVQTGAGLCITALDIAPSADSETLMRRCSDVLSDAGTRLAIEFLPYSALPTLTSARRLCERVGHDRCEVLVDAWMFFRGSNTWEELETIRRAEIAYVQFADAPAPLGPDSAYESRHRRALPGQGTFDLPRFCQVILASGYDGFVSTEVLASEFRALDPADQATQALAATLPFWSSVRSTNPQGI